MKTKVRVINNTERTVPIHKYEYTGKRFKKTNDIIREDMVKREKILFSGSHAAFQIWKSAHKIPHTARIEM